jgi:hypothetical protein
MLYGQPERRACGAGAAQRAYVMQHPAKDPSTLAEALAFLRDAGAPPRLLRHGQLVAEVAAELAKAIAALGVPINHNEAVVGAALHDAGKLACPAELTAPGRAHEAAGEQLLRDKGVPESFARFCRTHGMRPLEMPALEDLVVAVSDKLWRGARNEEAELALVDAVARQKGSDRWAVFTPLDECFERIAGRGDERLARQRDASDTDMNPCE